MLEKSNSNLEALKARTLELETSMNRKDNLITEQKRLLKATKEEAASNQEVIFVAAGVLLKFTIYFFQALENKYHLLMSVNQKYEEEILHMSEKMETYKAQLTEYEVKFRKDKQSKPCPLADALSRSSSSASSSVTTATTDITDLHMLIETRPSSHTMASPASPLLRATRPGM